MKRVVLACILAVSILGCAPHPSGKTIWEPKTDAEIREADREREERREEQCRENSESLEQFDDKWKILDTVGEALIKGTMEVLTGIPIP